MALLWRQVACVAVLASVLFLLPPSVQLVSANEDDVLDRIIADWRQRQSRIRRIQCVAEGTMLIPRGALTADIIDAMRFLESDMREFPPADDESPKSVSVYIDFDNNYFRKERTSTTFNVNVDPADAPTAVRRTEIALSNGFAIQTHVPRDKNNLDKYSPELYQKPPIASRFAVLAEDTQYFLAIGSVYGREKSHNPLNALRFEPDPTLFKLQGRAVHLGREQVVVRAPMIRRGIAYREFWIDTERQSAITRYATFVDDKPTMILEIDYRESSDGWLPKSWIYTVYRGDEIHQVEKMTVREFKVNPSLPPSLFHVKEAAGMVVYDMIANREYIVGKPESNLDELRKAHFVD